jgi:hypothetical protein
MIVTLELSPESTERLRDKAAQEGQTLEAFLGKLAADVAGSKVQAAAHVSESEDRDERPWRGVCVLPRARRPLFPVATALPVTEFHRRRRIPNLSWLRADIGDE